MKFLPSTLAGLLLIMGMSLSAFAAVKDPLAVGAIFVSPDGKYTAKLKNPPPPPPDSTAPKPTGFLLEIKEAGNDKGTQTLDFKALPFAIGWTRDSKNMITVERNGKAASTGVIRFEKKGWAHFFIEQPGDDFKNFDVVQQTIGRTNVKLVYKGASQKITSGPGAFQTITFTFDPESNVISGVVKKNIAQEAYFDMKDLCEK